MDYGWHDFVGNIGVVGVLVTYLLLQLNRLDAQSLTYSAVNAVCALLILISLLVDFNLSSFVIEIAWFCISTVGIFKYFRTQRSKRRAVP